MKDWRVRNVGQESIGAEASMMWQTGFEHMQQKRTSTDTAFSGRLRIVSLIGTMFALAACTSAHQPEHANASGMTTDTQVAFQQLDPKQYRTFVANWDNANRPVNCAVMRSPSDWNATMHPAPVMSDQTQLFAPPDTIFETHQILMAARVMPASVGSAQPFTVDQITLRDGVVSVNYKYQAPKPTTSSQVKSYFLVVMPKATSAMRHVRFIENGQPVCSVPLD